MGEDRAQIERQRDIEGASCAYCGSMLTACATCGAEMPAHSRFCGGCGTPLGTACPVCQVWVPRTYRFCNQCGATLSPHLAPVRHSPETVSVLANGAPVRAPREEKRRVAILFADLSGSTAMADRLEMESTYRVVTDCVSGLGRLASEVGGYVVKTLGDGLMVTFGAPVAYGDDPPRAARAALRMQAWLRDFAAEVRDRHGVELRVRIGISYGSVVAALLESGGRLVFDVLGDVVNVAQRVEAAAEPGTICVNEGFYRVTASGFEYQDRGMARVKGKSDPLQLYRLVAERHHSERVELVSFPLVGREYELALLQQAGARLLAGKSGVTALVGPSGIGKSRLLQEWCDELDGLGVTLFRGVGREKSLPLALWRTWLLESTGLDPAIGWEAAASEFRSLLQGDESGSAEALAALVADPSRLRRMEGEQSLHALRSALGVLLAQWSGHQAAVIVVDEAGLLDSVSLRLLMELSEADQTVPLQVVLAGNVAEGYPPEGAALVELQPISESAAREWMEGALVGISLTDELVAKALERAGGSPLYMQLMLSAARSAADPAQVLSVLPDSLYGLVRPEIDSLLPTDRELAQCAAVLGRQFPLRWLTTIGPDDDHGSAARDRLEGRGILIEQRPDPDRELAFRYGALQEVLYEGLMRDRRRELHALAAAVVSAEAEYHPDLQAVAAWHWQGAENWVASANWTLRAARHAASLYAGSEAEALYHRAGELAGRCGRDDLRAEAEAGLAEVALLRGDHVSALELFRSSVGRIEGVTPTSRTRLLLASARLGQARVLGRTGNLSEAVPLLQNVIDTLQDGVEPESRRIATSALIEQAHVFRDLGLGDAAERSAQEALQCAIDHGWQEERVAAGSALGLGYSRLARWAEAEPVLREAIAAAESYGDWKGASSCWINLGAGLQSAGRLTEATAAFERASTFAERIGDVEKTAIIRLDLGTIHLNRGEWTQAIDDYHLAVEQFRRMDHPLGQAAALCNLADACRWGGQIERVVPLLDQAGEVLTLVDAPFLHAHVAVARAEQCLAAGDAQVALKLAETALLLAQEADYQAGINLARLSLGRALRRVGAHAEAEHALRGALAGFEVAGEPLEIARAECELAVVLKDLKRTREAEVLQLRGAARIESLDAAPWLEHFA